MNYSPLLFSIVKGKWAILPRTVESQRYIVDQLLSEKQSSGDVKLFSELKPLMLDFLSDVDSQPAGQVENLDDLPDNSTLFFDINGTMLKYGTWCSYGTIEIAEALIRTASHPKIGSVVARIDSGGGAVDAIPPMIDAITLIKAMGKPVVASVDLCASAAYYVACHCNEIVANNNISAEIGSIGVMMSFMDWTKAYENEGGKQHKIYSTLSDWKNRPFELALEGKYDEIKSEELDPLARSFQEAVRTTRGNKLKQETQGLLAGRMFFAETAKEVGLIDHVGNEALAISRARYLRQQYIVNQFFNL